MYTFKMLKQQPYKLVPRSLRGPPASSPQEATPVLSPPSLQRRGDSEVSARALRHC